MSSIAFSEFIESLSIAEELLKIERSNYSNPPKLNEQKAVRGLRGGVSVLVVASFEKFLRDAIDEHLSVLSTDPILRLLSRMPEKVRIVSIYGTLERAMKGPQFVSTVPKINRLPDIKRACATVLSDKINPKSFNDTGNNPNSKNVKDLMGNIDIIDFFQRIKAQFERKWRSAVAHTFIADKLDEIVNRRHVVAHTADALNITRNQLVESVRFLKILSALIDKEIEVKVRGLKTLSSV